MTNAWMAVHDGQRWYLRRGGRGEYHRTKPGHYAPRGRIIGYTTEASAQRKADALNALESA